ncbi:MAG: DUF1778 domain-containing protein [Rhodospirillaceae bacterium]
MASTHTKMPFNLRIDPALKAAIEEAARLDHRTVTSLVEKLMIDHCRSVGIRVDLAQNAQR